MCVAAPVLLLQHSGSGLAAPGTSLSRGGAGGSTGPAAACEFPSLRLPLIFEPTGVEGSRRFLLRGPDYSTSIGVTGLLVTPEVAPGSPPRQGQADRDDRDSVKREPLQLRFPGADPGARITGTDRLPGKSNYFKGADPGRWRVGVPNYARVTVEGIYPGIDVVYYGRELEMEFDFVVAPGADPGRIRIEIASGHFFAVDDRGDLVIQTPDGPFRLRRPHVYQAVNGATRSVDGRYEVLAGRPRCIRFELAAHDAGHPLVIDPILSYASRYGGSKTEVTEDIAVDDEDNIYVTGWTRSTDFSAPAGESPELFGTGGDADVFVMKLAPDGETVLYSTFLGGTSFDQGVGIGVDSEGNAYVAGRTSFFDSGFPTTPGVYRSSPADFFISKLGPTGDLVYSTFFGGLNIASLLGLAVHGSGDAARVYIVGSTVRGFPTTANAYRREMKGGGDAFLSILEPAQAVPGDQLVYSTFYDGVGLDVAAGPDGKAYVTGSTVDPTMTLRHAFDTTYGGNREGFLAVFDPSQSGDASLVYSSYIGGSRTENGAAGDGGIDVDASGIALVTGTTGSSDFPVTPEGVRVSLESADAFFVAIDPSRPGRDSLLYGTYLGGSGPDSGTDVAAGPPGIAHLTGHTQSVDFPDGEGGTAVKFGTGSPGVGQDTFVAKIDWTRIADASLIDAAYVGGTGGDFARGIAAGSSDTVYVAGETSSGDTFDPTPGLGLSDGFVAGVTPATQLPDGVVGATSVDVLVAGFGSAPHTWTLLSGSLPAGLELADDGALSGEPTEVGSSTFTVEVTDSLDASRQRTYRKRIGTGAVPGDVLIRKAGVAPVPGRILPYYILLRNRSEKTLYNVGVVELLEGWFEFISSSPPPTDLEPRPTGNVHWTIPQMKPGQLEVITYRVRLPPEFPFGVEVSGEACLTEDDCNDEKEECYEEGKERCDNCCCLWTQPGTACTQCNTMEQQQCVEEHKTCLRNVGIGSSEVVPEGGTGGGCATKKRRTVGPIDPNEKEVASGPFIPPGEILGYTIHFENIGEIEARDVFLTDVLDSDLDLSTVQIARPLGGFEPLLPDTTISIFNDDDEEWNVNLDGASRTISFDLINIDLPPGETDSVFLVVQAPEDLPTGTEIRNSATIQFEVFDLLTTNETLNTIDDTPPVGVVDPLPGITFTEEFEISWSGDDPLGEVAEFFVYVSSNGGAFVQLERSSTAGSALFSGEVGNTYEFLCLAVDTAGNVEPMDGVAEATTTVELRPPPLFRRGDGNDDGLFDLSDPIFNLEYQFLGMGAPACLAALDTNADTLLDLSDPIYNFDHQFLGRPAPPPPYPECGPESLRAEEAQPCESSPESCR